MFIYVSNAKDHAQGEPHKRALDLHLKETKGEHAFERVESMKAANDSGQQLITTGIANMQSADLSRTKTEFEVAYFVTKEELPLPKYPTALQLEEKHGVDLGKPYRSDKSCNMFISHTGVELARNIGEKICFFSVLTDVSMDASITEKEAVFVQYLETNPSGRDTPCHLLMLQKNLPNTPKPCCWAKLRRLWRQGRRLLNKSMSLWLPPS